MRKAAARVIIFLGITLPASVLAEPPIVEPSDLGKQLQKAGGAAGYATAGESADITVVVGKVIQAALTLMGTLFLAQMIYGGYLWMTARGDEQQVEKAKHTIRTSAIGLGIMLGAYAITTFVVSRIASSTLG